MSGYPRPYRCNKGGWIFIPSLNISTSLPVENNEHQIFVFGTLSFPKELNVSSRYTYDALAAYCKGQGAEI